MITAVQELRSRGLEAQLHSRVVLGKPLSRVPGKRGSICLFPADTVVALRVTAGTSMCGFVFRTLRAPEALACSVAGVRPNVRLLVTTSTERRFERCLELLKLVQLQHSTVAQVDELLLRAAPLLASHTHIQHVATALLSE